MRIVIDLQSLQGNNRNRGIGRYCFNLTQAILKQASHHEILLCLNGNSIETIENIRYDFKNLIPENNIKVFELPKIYKNSKKLKIKEMIRESFITNLNPDLIYITSMFEQNTFDTPLSINKFNKTILNSTTLYDLIPYIYSKNYINDFEKNNFFFEKMQFLKQSNLLLTISDSVSSEAENLLGVSKQFIRNCSVGLDPKFKKINVTSEIQEKIKKKYGINKKFIFYLGGLDFRKNVQGLVAAYSILPKNIRNNFQLLIIISDVTNSVNPYLKDFNQHHNLNSGELILLKQVQEDDLILLYNLCSLFIFPSLHEGFGLPILEAMACGAPTIASNTSSMPEALGCEIGLFNPKKAQSIANKIHEVLISSSIKQVLMEHGINHVKKFTWEKTAKKVLTAFEDLHKENKNTKKLFFYNSFYKKKMAFVSPFPPLQTGIADYSAQLLPYLAHYYEITLITNQEKIDDNWINANFHFHDAKWFVKNANSFEVIIYQFGNSHYHYFMIELLHLFPGIIVLHDFFLSGLYQWIDVVVDKGEYAFYQSIYYSHGFPALINLMNKDRRVIIEDYPCNLMILNQALGIIVLSKHTIDLAHHWYGPNILHKFSLVCAPHFPKKISKINRESIRKKLKFTKNDFLICSFGFIGDTKQYDRTIQACADPRLSDINFKLIFVGGYADSEYKQLLYGLIKKYNLQDKVKFIGFSSLETFTDFLSCSDIAIQLRKKSRGETSACILNCLAYGIPTIVNAHGSIKEISDHVVIKLNDEFTDNELTEAIIKLYKDNKYRENLSTNALNYIEDKHHPIKITKDYYQAIENFYSFNNIIIREKFLIKKISIETSYNSIRSELLEISKSIATNRLPSHFPKILIDISNININCESLSSLPLMNLLRNLLTFLLKDFRVEMIFYNNILNRYCYATDLTTRFLNLENKLCGNIPIDIFSEDILIVVSNLSNLTPSNEQLKFLNAIGSKIFYLISNKILPSSHNFSIQNKLNFQINLKNIIQYIRGFICIDHESFDLFISYLDKYFSFNKINIKIFNINSIDINCFIKKLNELIIYDRWDIIWNDGQDSRLNDIFLKDLPKEVV